MSFRGGYSNPNSQAGTVSTATIPSACPTCRSAAITTTAKTPNADSYWRCDNCGDVWHGLRRQRHGVSVR